jgi:hypothetical protein
MINGKPSDFMNDFTKMLTAQNTAKRYKAGKLTPAEQAEINRKASELFPPEFIENVKKNLNTELDKIFNTSQEDGSR